MSQRKLETPEWIESFVLETIEDHRGVLIAPAVEDTELQHGSVFNLHVATATPGTVRGNHLHPRRTETICVLGGNFLAEFRSQDSENFSMEVPEGQVVAFRIPPGAAHAFKNVGHSMGYLLCYADIPFESTDIEPVRLME